MEKIKEMFPGLVVSLVASFVVGAFSAYMTGSALIAKMETRLERAERDVAQLTLRLENQGKETVLVSERLIRLETKIDILLQSSEHR